MLQTDKRRTEVLASASPKSQVTNWKSVNQPHLDINGLSVLMGKDVEFNDFIKEL
jgi:hypothetical protein